jgi:hypothetical protein
MTPEDLGGLRVTAKTARPVRRRCKAELETCDAIYICELPLSHKDGHQETHVRKWTDAAAVASAEAFRKPNSTERDG